MSAPPGRPPWESPGWLDEASAWTRERLAEKGHAPVTGIEPVRSWGISHVFRAETPHGRFYLKAVPPLFASEAGITQYLASRFPGIVPTPLAVDRERNWMLLPDLGERNLGGNDVPTEEWCALVGLLGRMQRECVGREAELQEAGCALRPLAAMPKQLDDLLEDDLAMSYLGEELGYSLREAAPLLKGVCARLARYALPETLVHGDFHGGNIAPNGSGYVIYDWTDGAISHPFFDLAVILTWHAPTPGSTEQEQVIEAYLREWEGLAPQTRLREALELSRPLGSLYQLISYYHILSALSEHDREDLDEGVPRWAERVLDALRLSGADL